ncbi:MAG: PAS domain-containing hybrid sensor histidine kinase/response regulator [Bacteroidota bacterium]
MEKNALTNKITELEAQVAELKQANFLYRSIIEDLPFGIQIFDKEGYSFKVNSKQKQLLGLPDKEEGIGRFNVLSDPYTVALELDKIYKKAYKGERIERQYEYNLALKENRWNTKKEKRVFNETIFPIKQKNKTEFVVSVLNDVTEETRRIRELAESEERFRNIYYNNLAAMLIVEPETRKIVEVNHAAENFYGYTKSQLLTMKIENLNTLPLAELQNEMVKDGEQGQTYSQFKHKLSDGQIREVEVYSSKILFNNKMHFCSLIHNITERKLFEKQLQEQTQEYYSLFEEYKAQNEQLLEAKQKIEDSEKHLRLLVEYAPDAIFIQTGWKFSYINKSGLKLFGVSSAEELIGQPVMDKFHPDSHDKIKQRIISLNEKSQVQGLSEQVFIKADGTEVHVETSGIPFNYYGKNGALVFVRDISERKKIQSEILKQKNLFETMFNSIQEGVVITNTEREILLANQGMLTTFGYQPAELIGKKTKIFYADEESFQKTGKKIFNKEASQSQKNYLTYYKDKKGKEFPGETFGTKLYDNAGSWIGNIGIMRDVSERVTFINELKLAKEKAEAANRLKTEFLNNMSHEIRTPMNGIMGFAEMLNDKNISDEKRSYFVKIVQNSSHQLLRIIDDILEIATLETQQQRVNEEPLNLNDFLMELFAVFNLKSKERNLPIYLKKGLPNSESEIISDKTKLNKIVSNLLENALKYTPEGYIEMGYYLENKSLVIYVKDTGIGISPENHKLIFDRFSQEDKEMTRKHGGLGLGLAISKENAKLLGGDITLISEKQKGSTFYLTIPYKIISDVSETNSNATNNKPEPTDNKNYTVLVAEDEEINFLFIEALFEQQKAIQYDLIHAKNGKEAVDICMKNKNIDIILMDIKMPLMNGFEATKQIKSSFPHLPIIAQTAYSTESDRKLALKNGCDNFISKPLKKEKLFELMNQHLKTIQ